MYWSQKPLCNVKLGIRHTEKKNKKKRKNQAKTQNPNKTHKNFSYLSCPWALEEIWKQISSKLAQEMNVHLYPKRKNLSLKEYGLVFFAWIKHWSLCLKKFKLSVSNIILVHIWNLIENYLAMNKKKLWKAKELKTFSPAISRSSKPHLNSTKDLHGTDDVLTF